MQTYIHHINKIDYACVLCVHFTTCLIFFCVATRDDLVLSTSDVSHCFLGKILTVEEKIDGANMGISLQNNHLYVQNRSHYVTSEYHAQFKYLDKWLFNHNAELRRILMNSDRYILYGEWVYARHSIHYTNLPDWFVAFDLYDKLEEKFWSRNRLENHLHGSSIYLINIVASRSFDNLEQLSSLVHTKSIYYDGEVEGLYFRISDESNEWLLDRGKIVRSDFISGNDFWSKGGVIANIRSDHF